MSKHNASNNSYFPPFCRDLHRKFQQPPFVPTIVADLPFEVSNHQAQNMLQLIFRNICCKEKSPSMYFKCPVLYCRRMSRIQVGLHIYRLLNFLFDTCRRSHHFDMRAVLRKLEYKNFHRVDRILSSYRQV